MAITKLPVNYVDDIIDTSTYDKRRYNIIENDDGTVSLDEKTDYLVKGSWFNSVDINRTNGTVNEAIDAIESNSSDISKAKEDIGTNTRSITNNSTAIENIISGKTKTKSCESADVATKSNTSGSADNDIIVCTNLALSFNVASRKCTISNENVTANSLADVYFTRDCYESAQDAFIDVETVDGAVELTCVNIPSKTLVATIRVRVV